MSERADDGAVAKKIERAALEQMKHALPHMEGALKRWDEMVSSGKMERPKAEMDRVIDGSILKSNKHINDLFVELIDQAYDTLTLMKKIKTNVNLTESKVSTSNDMTSLARAQLVEEITGVQSLCYEFVDLATQHYFSSRIEAGRRYVVNPSDGGLLHDDIVQAIKLSDKSVISAMRYKSMSVAAQLKSALEVWKCNKSAIMTARAEEE